MLFSFGIPGISVFETDQRRKTDDDFLMLDVREQDELAWAKIEDARVHWIPLSELSRRGTDALHGQLMIKDREIIVFCHHGSRSRQVAAWLKQQGWKRVLNMEGGIDAYAAQVDPDIGRY